jgi:hypothetical protein
LAKALLERGGGQTVLRYLNQCLDFWKSGEDHLLDWTALIKAGRTPDFDQKFLF